MLLTIFLAVVVCAAITLMMFSAVAFIQDKKMFSSAPKEFRDVIKARDKELFYGARAIGWIQYKESAFYAFCCISGNLCFGSLDMYADLICFQGGK